MVRMLKNLVLLNTTNLLSGLKPKLFKGFGFLFGIGLQTYFKRVCYFYVRATNGTYYSHN
jgi:hypothetical protein